MLGSSFFDEPYEIPEPDHYTFVYEEPNNGWWLKIDDIEKLGDYMMKTANMYADCLSEYLCHADNPSNWSNRLRAIVMFGERRHLTIYDAIMQFRLTAFSQMCEDIREHGYIVLNKVGGYHNGPVEYSQFVHRKTFTWPDFKESDIRITRFPGGDHYYVRIGDMELHEGDRIKWDTESDARMAAMRYIRKEDSE